MGQTPPADPLHHHWKLLSPERRRAAVEHLIRVMGAANGSLPRDRAKPQHPAATAGRDNTN